MLIERLDPPVLHPRLRKPGIRNRSYALLFGQLVASPGQWMAVPLDDVTGSIPATKQAVLYSAARARNLSIQTTIQDGRIYIRLTGAESTVKQ